MGVQSYNLKTFGCSFTYGHGLADCIQEDMMTHGFSPSNMAWPNHLKGICGFKKLYNLSNSKWKKVYKKHRNNLLVYDKENLTLKKTIKKLVK